MSSYHKLRVTVEVELPLDGVEEAYEYVDRANEGYPDPMGCTPVFFAMQEASDALLYKMRAYTATDNVKLQIVKPDPNKVWSKNLNALVCNCEDCK